MGLNYYTGAFVGFAVVMAYIVSGGFVAVAALSGGDLLAMLTKPSDVYTCGRYGVQRRSSSLMKMFGCTAPRAEPDEVAEAEPIDVDVVVDELPEWQRPVATVEELMARDPDPVKAYDWDAHLGRIEADERESGLLRPAGAVARS